MNDLILQSIPSPEQGVWYLGPFPLRAYSLCIIAGVIAAVWIGDRRWVARGGRSGEIADIAIWAVPFGIVGGRLYHVATDSGCYLGGADRCEGIYKGPWGILYVWQGGLGIWGAIALGAVGAYIGAAYFFTSSTSFANPAITVGRMFSDTFAGIAPTSALPFIGAQLVGAGIGWMLIRWLFPIAPPEPVTPRG